MFLREFFLLIIMKGGLTKVVVIGFFVIVIINFASALTNVSSCKTLNTGNENYTINKSIASGHDCMIINASNITLDCQGYNITYGNDSGGWGIFVSNSSYNGYDNVTIKNCIIIENATGGGEGAIFFGTLSKRAIVYNNTISTYNTASYGINFNDNSVSADISFNNITTFEDLALGIYIGYGGNNSNIRNNNITVSGSTASGIYMRESSRNWTIFKNDIVTSGGRLVVGAGGIFLESETNGMNISSNNITVYGDDVAGIWMETCSNISAERNTISATGEIGDGVYSFGASGVNLTLNTITLSGNMGYGIYSLWIDAASIFFYNNVITTLGNFSYGIASYMNSDDNISSNNITTWGNSSYGIFLNQSNNTLLTSNRITTKGENSYVLYFISSSNETIYNNIFNTSTNGSGVYAETSDSSYFNTTETTATNIINRASVGGNFWTNNASTGYSDNCIDTDADYFCDTAYTLSEGTDYLPLANRNNMLSACATLNIAGKTYYLNNSLTWINGTCINIVANRVTLNLSNYTISGNGTGYGINVSNYNYSNVIFGTIFNFSSGIYVSSSLNNAFTDININSSVYDAILLKGVNSDNNNFTRIVVSSTNASHYDINLSTEGIDGTWLIDNSFISYAFSGAGGKINFEQPGIGKVEFLEAVNGSKNDLGLSDLDIESNLVFVNSSSNSGLNRSANITLYGITYTDPKPQFSADGVTFTDCTTTTSPSCTELNFSGTTFVFNVTHFTFFKSAEAYVAPSTVGGASGGSSIVSFWNMTYTFTDEQFKQGYTKELPVKSRIGVKVNYTNHYVGVVEVPYTTAKINVSSIPQQAVFLPGDTKKFDVTGDDYYDIAVTLNRIVNNKANVTLLSIHETIASETQPENQTNETTNTELKEERKNLTLLWILIAVGVISILSYLGYKKFWKKIKRLFG